MYALIIDTETTGLPPRNTPASDTEKWAGCRIVQIAWELHDPTQQQVVSECYVVKPDGFVIPKEATRIHGIEQRYAEEHGVAIERVWERLADLLPSVSIVVAHNISFDDAVIQSEMNRSGKRGLLDEWARTSKHCTMKAGTPPGQKWPKLAELYKRYFGVDPDGRMHSADADVRACARIYHRQVQRQGAWP